MKKLVLLLIILFSLNLQGQNDPKGELFIIGGGERSPSLVKSMIETAALEKEDYVVILPMASSIPDTVAAYITGQLKEIISNPVITMNFKKDEVFAQSAIDSLKNAQLIYIPGGDQNRFMEVVRNTPLHEAIKTAYYDGATIAGTSAGAAVMSKKMITGDQKTQQEYGAFEKIYYDNAITEEGLGLLENVIIDQHFITRSRYNRLLSVLAENPEYTCIGIDESTAIIVRGNVATVVGDSQVVVLSNPELISDKSDTLVSFRELDFALLSQGETFLID